MVKVEFKNRIREVRREKGLRQVDLARMVGVFQSEISEIECGKRVPSVYLAKRIAKALGVSLDDLFFLELSHFNDYGFHKD
jgi:putative transcriptional regulator